MISKLSKLMIIENNWNNKNLLDLDKCKLPTEIIIFNNLNKNLIDKHFNENQINNKDLAISNMSLEIIFTHKIQ